MLCTGETRIANEKRLSCSDCSHDQAQSRRLLSTEFVTVIYTGIQNTADVDGMASVAEGVLAAEHRYRDSRLLALTAMPAQPSAPLDFLTRAGGCSAQVQAQN